MTSRLSAAGATAQSPRLSAAAVTAPAASQPPMPAGSGPDTGGPPAGYQRLRLRITGASPLVMHNGQLADPINPIAREMKRVSGKRAKTEADYEQLAKLEWLGGLYLSQGAPCLPGELIEAGLIEAARKSRRGQQAKAGMISDGLWLLDYDGPREIDALWQDQRFRLVVGVRVQRSRIMRTRPIFRDWAATVDVDYMPDQLNRQDVLEMARGAGRLVGLGDWRPKFGRFEVAEV